MNDVTDPDYYRRIKINRRWYLIVPELYTGSHSSCAFYDRAGEDDENHSICKLCPTLDDGPPALDNWDRHDCGSHGSIFVAPSKFTAYLAARVARRMDA
jgi:hypothetical protein